MQAPPVSITGHPIAPTEFPKGWSAAGCNSFGPGDCQSDPEPVTYTPQEEDTGGSVTSSPRKGQRLPTAAYPQKSVIRILARGQSSTDLNLAQRRVPLGTSVGPAQCYPNKAIKPLPRPERDKYTRPAGSDPASKRTHKIYRAVAPIATSYPGRFGWKQLLVRQRHRHGRPKRETWTLSYPVKARAVQ